MFKKGDNIIFKSIDEKGFFKQSFIYKIEAEEDDKFMIIDSKNNNQWFTKKEMSDNFAKLNIIQETGNHIDTISKMLKKGCHLECKSNINMKGYHFTKNKKYTIEDIKGDLYVIYDDLGKECETHISYINTNFTLCKTINQDFKYDSGKLLVNLVDPNYIEDIAKVLTYGAEKYQPNSWQNLANAEDRYKNALLRHTLAYLKGELIDEESELTHLSHMATNIMFLSHFEREKTN